MPRLLPHSPPRPLRHRRQVLVDVDRRASFGTPAYLAAWLAVVLGEDGLRDWPGLVYSITGVLLVLAVARLLLHRHFARLVSEREALARLLLRGVLLANAATISVVGVLSLTWAPLESSADVLLLVGGVICTAGTMSLALDPVIRFGMPSVVLGPYVVALLSRGQTSDLPLVALILLFWTYIVRAAKDQHDDYWRSLETLTTQRQRATELELMSITDTLTGLSNRLYFERRLEETWSQARRSGGLVSLLLIDLDHFKRVNDTHGHATGDRCLVLAATAIQRCAQRGHDLVARHGGEEFTVLLPGTSQPAAAAIAERIRAAVADIELHAGGETVPVTCSIGVATMAPMRDDADGAALVEAADVALYAAKESGRNRVAAA